MKKCYGFLFINLVLLFVCLTAAAWPQGRPSRADAPDSPDKTLSPYFVVLSDDPEQDALPLKSTRAQVKITGVVAEVTITQSYQNLGKKALEAIYVFPASTRAAVHALSMTVGERVIVAEIMERKKARDTYEEAKQAGKTTSLLEQQRLNVFQMNVANILPGDEVKVDLKYLELLEPEDQVYEFVFPTVVGPRYSSMAPEGAADTERWVKNPYLTQGQAPPYTFGLNLELHSGLPIVKLGSPSHEVEVHYAGKTVAQVKIKDEKTAGDRDFVLRYGLGGDRIETGLLLYPGKDENFFLLMLEPPARVAAEAVLPREYVFIVDVSGSMHGFPLELSKALMKDIITTLRPQDFINVLLFESGSAVLSESGSLPASEDNKQKALAFINARPGGGGTEILKAFKRVLALPRTPNTSRIVVVATDGYVHVEPQVFQLIRDSLGTANLFPFGIGTAVNRHLIEGMARAGMGEPFIVLNPADAPQQAAKFRRYLESPVLSQIKVSFEGFEAYEVEPPALPDLFALRPLTMLGKYRGSPAGTVVVEGRTARGAFTRKIKVEAGKASPDHAALRLLWARHRIMRLADLSQLKRGRDEQVIQEVTNLGLKYSLMSPYTSFVAVDQVKRSDGQVVTVKQPLPLPQGVSDLAVGGGGPGMQRAKMAAPLGYFAAGSEVSGPPLSGVTKLEEREPPSGPQLAVKIQVAQVRGNLKKAAVQQALEAHREKLTSCCREAQAQGVPLPREITLAITIGADGQVTGTELVKAPVEAKALETCLSQAVKAISFSSPGPQGAKVTVTLTLEMK